MDNEWKELKIDNLPPDILTGDYEFEHYSELEKKYEVSVYCMENMRTDILHCVMVSEGKYRYRKPEPKAPTHEEIMSKWWYSESNNLWERVDYYHFRKLAPYEISDECFDRSDFALRKSADIPPEA